MPPFTGVAVKVILAPAQISVCEAVILTEGATDGVTVIEIVFEVSAAGETQLALLVITHVTASLSFKEFDEKEFELVPAFVPFTFH